MRDAATGRHLALSRKAVGTCSEKRCSESCQTEGRRNERRGEESGERIVAHTEKSANMGISQTLSAFVDYCTENYPADHYGLILWNHGGGPLWGYGSDELFKNDSLLLEELRSAMDHKQWQQMQSEDTAPDEAEGLPYRSPLPRRRRRERRE